MKILTVDDLAALLRLRRKTVLDLYTKQPGFPANIATPRKPAWLEEDVHKFMQRKSAQTSHTAS
jgi:predicted DNA-binding transcriptional regulator AlpA